MPAAKAWGVLAPLCAILSTTGSFATPADQARLDTVVAYANQVLSDAADHYHPDHPSPLLANGVDVYTKQPLKWFYPDGKEAVLSDFVEQQNLMRIFAALTALTG